MNVRKFSTLIAATGLLAIILAASNATAQGRKMRQRNPDRIVSALKEHLSLTDEQESQVRSVIEKHVENRKAIFEKYRQESREGKLPMRDEMRQNREDRDKQLETILSKEQMDEYRKYQDEKRKKKRGWRESGQSAG